jgi:hypothetical protein
MGRDHIGDLGVSGSKKLKWILEKQFVNWIELAQDKIQWRAFVIMAINVWVSWCFLTN